MVRHEAGSAIVSVPVVVVPSVYDPPEVAVHVPDTCSDPVTGAAVHPTPSDVRSTWPLMFKQEPATVHVPTTLPPQAVTFEHDAITVLVELAEVEPLPVDPWLVPELPPVEPLDPAELPLEELPGL
jgi:hypothetical protein